MGGGHLRGVKLSSIVNARIIFPGQFAGTARSWLEASLRQLLGLDDSAARSWCSPPENYPRLGLFWVGFFPPGLVP